MDHWLRAWKSGQKPADRAIVLLDYDGTLAPIAATPGQARLSRRTRQVLSRLTRVPWLRLAVISGRSLPDLKRMVRLPRVIYAGNHGLELQGRGLSFVHPRVHQARPVLRRLARELEQALQAIPGAWIERKGASLSVHWRAVPPSAQRRFHRVVTQATAPLQRRRRIRLTRGKRVIEIRPAINWDKGRMIRWLHHQLDGDGAPRGNGYWLVFIGDDQTDEDAFAMVRRLKGASIAVGRPMRPTAATHWLRGPGEVHRWLVELHRHLTSPRTTTRREV